MKYIFLILSSFFFISCVNQEINTPLEQKKVLKESIYDLKVIPQNVDFYTKNIEPLHTNQAEYEKNYFRAWNIEKIDISIEDAMWADKIYSAKNSYGENLQPRKASFFQSLLENENYENFATLNKNAITLQHLNIRAMPSDKPLFMNPKKAGEGFPFDYLQNSTISPNKPLLISHYSKDKEWVFVESSFAYGWVKSKDIVEISKEDSDLWQNAEQVFLIQDRVPLYSIDGKFLFKSQIGMMLALVDEDETSYTVLTASKTLKNKVYFFKTKISKNMSHKGKLEFTPKNINLILSEINRSKYGWGGIYGERDCSSTLRDFYAPFGLWLPRNSYKQSLSGEVIYLESLSVEDKIKMIKENGVPFKTLLYKKGHIGLYVGTFNNKLIFYQNVWGVKTVKNGKEGRFIIGKPIFSTLEVGSHLKYFDKNATILHKLKSMTKL